MYAYVSECKNKKIKGEKMPRIKWKWKYNRSESVRHSKGHAKGKV
jgi:hypothetical protein